MSSARVEWHGLDELKAALRNLPRDLTGDAQDIVVEAAHTAASQIIERYPEKTGNLRAGVRVDLVDHGQFGVMAVVKNTARHAWIYDYGTQVRKSRFGNRGMMPAKHVFGPACGRNRRRMYSLLVRMMEGHGLSVTAGISGEM